MICQSSFFPLLSPFTNNLLKNRDLLSSHLVSRHPSKVTSLLMRSFCLFPSLQRADDPAGQHHDSLWVSSLVLSSKNSHSATHFGNIQRLFIQTGKTFFCRSRDDAATEPGRGNLLGSCQAGPGSIIYWAELQTGRQWARPQLCLWVLAGSWAKWILTLFFIC